VKKLSTILMIAAVWPVASWAQVPAPNETGVSMGHFHVYVRDVDAAKKVWIGHLGGTPIKVDGTEVVKFPGVLVFLEGGLSAEGSGEGNVVNHIGFFVTNPKDFLAKWKDAGLKVDFNDPKIGDHGYIYTQEGLKIEIQENHILKDEGKSQTAPIVTDHVHFNWPSAYEPEAQAWYIERFGAKPVMKNEADIPGMRLRWAVSKSAKPLLPTKGQTLDHLGFEVKGLEAFCKKLESSGVKFDELYSKTRHKSFANARFTDPWGASVELTEGLSRF
jgi:catechol 2,3-dioxygenase-like lactoylglutathione lyase family enzyme